VTIDDDDARQLRRDVGQLEAELDDLIYVVARECSPPTDLDARRFARCVLHGGADPIASPDAVVAHLSEIQARCHGLWAQHAESALVKRLGAIDRRIYRAITERCRVSAQA
jgi:hypothetical protein